MATNLLNLSTFWKRNQERTLTDNQDYQPREVRARKRLRTAPSIYSILKSFGPFPPYSFVVGVCQDGLPFMISLDNPKSGSILVVGENSVEKTQILKAMSLSASMLNNPEQVRLCVITNKVDRYASLMKYPNCHALLTPYERAAGEMVIEFASIAEQRRSGRERGGVMMLLIDDFQSFAPLLSDYSVYLNLKTLVSKGPISGIWPIISIKPEDVHLTKGQLLHSFGTYIFEKVDNHPDLLPTAESMIPPELTCQPNYNVIIGGRLIPISTLSN
jgi:hypothetical protein